MRTANASVDVLLTMAWIGLSLDKRLRGAKMGRFLSLGAIPIYANVSGGFSCNAIIFIIIQVLLSYPSSVMTSKAPVALFRCI